MAQRMADAPVAQELVVPSRRRLPSQPAEMLEAARATSLQIGGPNLTRLGVSSSIRGEGRTSLTLAMATVQQVDFGRRVLLLDLDLDSAALARQVGVSPWPGVSELMRGEASLEEIVQPVGDSILVISAGATAGSGAKIMAEVVRTGVMARLSELADVVIADLPPLLGCSFGSVAAGLFPDLLLVVRSRVTPAARIREATRNLPVEPLVVLNGARSELPRWLRKLLAV
jgi:MinD-like ATPase involved in chromosome partitioning or flagellar assembly